MRRALSALDRPTIGSLLTAAASQGALLASGVLSARMLGPENRGLLALLILIPTLVSEIGGLGLPTALPYFIARQPERVAATIRAVTRPALLQSSVGAAIHVGAVLIVFWTELDKIAPAAAFSLLLVPLHFSQQYGIAILQGMRRFTSYNLVRLIPVFGYSVLLSAMFVVNAGTLDSVVMAFVAANVIASALAIVAARPYASDPEHASSVELAPLFRFALKGFIGAKSPIETYRLDQVLVGLLLTPVALGLYVVALAFTNLPRFIAQSVGTIAYPRIAAEVSVDSARSMMWRSFWLVAGLSGVVVLGLEIVIGSLIPLFFGHEFAAAVLAARILLLNAFLLSLRRALVEGARGVGYPGSGSAAEAASWLFFIPALFVFGTSASIEGIASALTASSAFSLLVLLALIRFSHRPRKTSLADVEELGPCA